MRRKLVLLFLTIAVLIACHGLPKKELRQYPVEKWYTLANDTLQVYVKNNLEAPLQLILIPKEGALEASIQSKFPLIIAPKKDTLLTMHLDTSSAQMEFDLADGYIDTTATNLQPFVFPFLKQTGTYIMQAYGGSFSHNQSFSKYALDFALKEGDTVCAAADGIVVGSIDGYRYGGNDRKWRDYANFITIYHPDMHVFSQYVHLKHKGSLVSVNEKVKAGEPIGISGKTGFTSKEHLHFNVIKIDLEGAQPVQIEFEGGMEAKNLQKDQRVSH